MRRAASVPPDLPGYTFVRTLGSGGFSDVYLYDQKLPRRRVAVKVLLTDELSTATRSAFVDEANLMAQLSAHPYIVTIFHADVAADDRPYFVMEYCSGPSLAETYKRSPMSVVDALRTGVRLSSAIATAHAAGILHRDVKPANVLTNDYGWPALTDFGISSAVDDELQPVHTGTLADALAEAEGATGSTSVGMSVPWSPPEMFEDDPQPDIRSDVFSLAATLYTVLAGRTPFEVRGRSNGTLDLIGRIERGAITPLDRDDLPRSLVAVLMKGMAFGRDDRFATAVDFARALQRVELELGYAPTTIDVPNILISEAPRAGTSDDDDATRIRSVAVVDAQPAETVVRATTRVEAQPAPVPVADAATAPPVGDSTVLRPRAVAPDPASPPATAPDAAAPPLPRTRASRVAIAVGGSVVALAVIAVVVGLSIGGIPSATDPSPVPTGGGAPAVVDTVPTPREVAPPVLEGTAAVFTVENPDPQPDDGFIWRVSTATDDMSRRSAEGRIVVDGAAGQRTCVEIWVVRDGRQSPDPYQGCFPG